MHLLAINTSGPECSVAVMKQDKSVFSDQINLPNMHAESLFGLIDSVLLSSGIQCKDINKILVVTGPGSFFGTRVGVAAAHAFGISLIADVLGVTSLELDAFCRLQEENFISETIRAFVDIGKSKILEQSFSRLLMPNGEISTTNNIPCIERHAKNACELFIYKQTQQLPFADANPIYHSIPSYMTSSKI